MSFETLSPSFFVERFSTDLLSAYIRHVACCNDISDVLNKPQLKYLNSYLTSDHIDAKTVVIEGEYVDKYFLVDYASYYSRCFHDIKKKCSRVHFFKKEFDEKAFVEALQQNNEEFIKELETCYLGFAVIRPIPENFIARLCLRPYKYLEQDASSNKDGTYKVIASEEKLSLFGLELKVDTTAFIEQDTVISECATTAIWTLLNAGVSPLKKEHLPSLSTIATQAASNGLSSKMYPSQGLTYQQVSTAIKSFSLEPHVIEIADIKYLKELVYAYVSNDIPVLLGGEVLCSNEDGSFENKGRHLNCILGYHHSDTTSTVDENDGLTNEINFLAHNINKIYIHDDRIGPYVRGSLATKKTSDTITIKGKENKNTTEETNNLIKLSIYEGKQQYFKPEILILGVYHKIRVPYYIVNKIATACIVHIEHLVKKSIPNALSGLSHSEDTDQDKRIKKEDFLNRISSSAQELHHSRLEIKLSTNNKVKSDLIKGVHKFNGSEEAIFAITRNMPRYIWRVRFLSNKNECLSELLLDATAVPQGDIIIGLATYNEHQEKVWGYFSNLYQNKNVQFSFASNQELYESNIKPLFRFFTNVLNKLDLNTSYGPVNFPRREFKAGELDAIKNIKHRPDVFTINNNNYDKLIKTKKYAWVINEVGDLIVGIDVEVKTDSGIKYMGHPTITDGRPARIAGELLYINNQWNINLKSGTYSAHLQHDKVKSKRYLQTVVNKKLDGLEVTIDLLDQTNTNTNSSE